jgi:hypothetical protein
MNDDDQNDRVLKDGSMCGVWGQWYRGSGPLFSHSRVRGET